MDGSVLVACNFLKYSFGPILQVLCGNNISFREEFHRRKDARDYFHEPLQIMRKSLNLHNFQQIFDIDFYEGQEKVWSARLKVFLTEI